MIMQCTIHPIIFCIFCILKLFKRVYLL